VDFVEQGQVAWRNFGIRSVAVAARPSFNAGRTVGFGRVSR